MDISEDYRLPNFLIVGAARCGTTSLYHYLKSHPDVCMSRIKEPSFFIAELVHHPRGVGDENKIIVRDIQEYRALFAGSASRKAIGEATPTYLYYYDHAIGQIRQWLGHPRIIITLRNPVDRAFSAYMLRKNENRETLSFEDALNAEDQRLKDGWLSEWAYRDRGLYYAQVKAYLNAFPHVHVLLYDDLNTQPQAVMKSIFQFLEIDESHVPDVSLRYNVSGTPKSKQLNNFFIRKSMVQRVGRAIGMSLLTEEGWIALRDSLRGRILKKTTMSPETRAELTAFFRADILRLQDLIGRDLSRWLAG